MTTLSVTENIRDDSVSIDFNISNEITGHDSLSIWDCDIIIDHLSDDLYP